MISDEQIKKAFDKLEANPVLYEHEVDNISLYFILRYHIESVYRLFHSEKISPFRKALQ